MIAVLEGRRLGVGGNDLDLVELLRHSSFERGGIVFVLNPVEWGHLVRQPAHGKERVPLPDRVRWACRQPWVQSHQYSHHNQNQQISTSCERSKSSPWRDTDQARRSTGPWPVDKEPPDRARARRRRGFTTAPDQRPDDGPPVCTSGSGFRFTHLPVMSSARG